MLKRYKLVSIVYGGSGKEYADEMNKLILQQSEQERYPITSKIVMESVLTGDLLSSITNLFTQTEYCIAFLTADDCCVKEDKKTYRLRQNVVFELGMAIYRLGSAKCILLSDFDPKDSNVELPSDLQSVGIKYFRPENRQQVFRDVLEKILSLNQDEDGEIPRYDNLLKRQSHCVNYDDLFSACSHLDAHGEAYLMSVLNYWYEECAGFTHFEERCLYFLERICFISMFGRHSWVNDFLEKTKNLTGKCRKQDIDYCGKASVDFIKNLSQVVRGYVQLKLRDTKTTRKDYEELLETLLDEPAEESGVTNPLALTVYYDYLGLLHLHLYEIAKDEKHLLESTKCFRLAVERYAGETDLNLKIWKGFISYNLARCYLTQYRLWSKPEDLANAQTYFANATRIRKQWPNNKESFHMVIRSALSYEYFICKLDEINSYNLVEGKNPQDIVEEYTLLEGELESYMLKNEQLERLVFVKKLLTERRKQALSDCPLGEGQL